MSLQLPQTTSPWFASSLPQRDTPLNSLCSVSEFSHLGSHFLIKFTNPGCAPKFKVKFATADNRGTFNTQYFFVACTHLNSSPQASNEACPCTWFSIARFLASIFTCMMYHLFSLLIFLYFPSSIFHLAMFDPYVYVSFVPISWTNMPLDLPWSYRSG